MENEINPTTIDPKTVEALIRARDAMSKLQIPTKGRILYLHYPQFIALGGDPEVWPTLEDGPNGCKVLRS